MADNQESSSTATATSNANGTGRTSKPRKRLTAAERLKKAEEKKEKLLKKQEDLKAQLEQADELINLAKGMNDNKRSERTKRLIVFAGKIETIFGKGTASDLLFQAIENHSKAIEVDFKALLNAQGSKSYDDEIAKIENDLKDNNDKLVAKMAALQEPGANIVSISEEIRTLGLLIKSTELKLEEVKKKRDGDNSSANNEEDDELWGTAENPF